MSLEHADRQSIAGADGPASDGLRQTATATAEPMPAARSFRRITFTSDFLRVDDGASNRLVCPQSVNVDWLHELIAPSLRLATGAATQKLLMDTPGDPQGRLALYRRLGVEFSTRGWASLYELDLVQLLETIDGLTDPDTLYVTFEAPPYLYDYFRHRQLACIDFCIHPIRFLDDYVLGVRSTSPRVTAHLRERMIARQTIDLKVRQLSARAQRHVRRDIPDPAFGSSLFVAQLPVDASLIRGRRMTELYDVVDELSRLCGKGGKVYYKRHPHNQDVGWDERIVAAVPHDISLIDASIYDLLGCGRLAEVVALSSGTLYEALYFGVPTRRGLTTPHRFVMPGFIDEPDQYVPVQPSVVEDGFWLGVLGGQPPAPGGSQLCLRDRYIRNSLNLVWGA